jgi:hypothetical protein
VSSEYLLISYYHHLELAMRASHLKELDAEEEHGRDIPPVLVSQLLHVGVDGCSGNWNLRVFSFLAPSFIPLQFFPQISGSTEFRN